MKRIFDRKGSPRAESKHYCVAFQARWSSYRPVDRHAWQGFARA